jgi:hypothetical protein
MPAEVGWSAPIGTLHRVQGIYRSGLEFSKLVVGYEGSIKDLNSVASLDFCVAVDEACRGELKKRTKAKGAFREDFEHFGFVDALVLYKGEGAPEELCPLGRIVVVHLIEAHSIDP